MDRTPGSGYLTFDGLAQSANTLFERPIAELSRWGFVVGDDSDRIGFNAIDQAGTFNTSVVANVRPLEAVSLPKSTRMNSSPMREGKLTTLAMFAHAAYDKNYDTLHLLWREFGLAVC